MKKIIINPLIREPGKLLLLIDGSINIVLGIILLAYSEIIVDFIGIPATDNKFYPNILGAVLLGIGVALFIEYKGKNILAGLGLGGAIAINLSGGIVLFLWLVSDQLVIPLRGRIILWLLDTILIVISLVEYFVNYEKIKKDPES